MSDATPEYRVAQLDAIHVTAAANTTLTEANKLRGLKSFPVTESTEWAELKHHNSDGWSRWAPVWHSASGSLSGEVIKGSETQLVMETAQKNDTSFFVHVIENAAATVGQVKGKRYELVIESKEKPHEAGALVTFNYPVKVQGPPIDIVAA